MTAPGPRCPQGVLLGLSLHTPGLCSGNFLHSQTASTAPTLMPPRPADLVLYPVLMDPSGGHVTPDTSPGTCPSNQCSFSRWKRPVSKLHAGHLGTVSTPFPLFQTHCCWPLPAPTWGIAVLASELGSLPLALFLPIQLHPPARPASERQTGPCHSPA